MKKTCLSCAVLLMLAGWAGAYTYPLIDTGTQPTFVYQRDVSPNKDNQSILSECLIDGTGVTTDANNSWVWCGGTNNEQGVYYRFQAPEGYTIKRAQVFTRTFMWNGWETIVMNAYWSASFPVNPWDYFGTNKFITRTSTDKGGAVETYSDTVTFDVNSNQLALGFTASQSGWHNQMGDKGWFSTDNGGTYDPGLIVTLTIQAPPIKGDINGDQVVNAADLDALKALIASGTTDLQYDLNGDGAVGQADVDYLAHDILHIQVTNNIITLGTDSTFVYQRDVSLNKDDQTPLYEAIFDHAGVTANADNSWAYFAGTNGELGVYYKFQAPDDYLIKSASVFARSFMWNGWETITLNAYWSPSFPQNVWDYMGTNKFLSRTNQNTDESIQTYTDTIEIDVNSSQLALGFTASQSGWHDQVGDKGWFVTDNSATYDPGLKVTLSIVPVEKVSVVLDNFETDPFMWTRAEPNDQFSVAKQSAVKYEGSYAMDFHVDHTASDGYWCRVQGILPAGQDWTKYKKIKGMIKSSAANPTTFIGWDFLINGVTDANRVNGPSGCGSFVPPADTEWHSFTFDLTPWTRDNVTGLEFWIYTGNSISSSFDLYFDDIRLEGDPQPGDANKDGKVDVSDLGILAANYGATSGAAWTTGDFNKDGKVDVSDLGILAANYGSGTGSSLDFNADAKAFGLAVGGDEAKADQTPVTSTLGCGSAGLPLIAGLLLAGLLLSGLKLKE